MSLTREKFENFRRRLAKVVEVGAAYDTISRGYDFLMTGAIAVNLVCAVLYTFSGFRAAHETQLDTVEAVTTAFFAVDYCLRLLAAKYIYPRSSEWKSLARYVFSFTGIIDLLSFLPYFLPVFFPDGAVAFRIFRIIRIFRLFRINAYYDSLNAITEVLRKKRQQLVSSVFIILVLMLSSSLCMYSVEHEAQPEVFKNAFSGLWWSVSTLLTVGYGDIYPITTLGKALGIAIAFLGVGMVAIPTGIISAGFVEQYARMQGGGEELDIHFIKIRLEAGDEWADKSVAQLRLPHGMILTAIHRDHEVLIPRGDVVLKLHDTLVLGAEPIRGGQPIRLKEVLLSEHHPWSGQYIRDLDISRQSVIIMVRRGDKVLIPKGSTRLRAGDMVLIHTKMNLADSVMVEV